MRGRRKAEFAVSFFAFQDIVTAVTGVLILVTLLLSLLMNEVEATVRQTESPPEPQFTTEELESLRSQIEYLRRQLEASQGLAEFAASHSAEEVRQRLVEQAELVDRAENDMANTTTMVDQLKAQLKVEQDRLAAMAADLGVTELEARGRELQDEIERIQSSDRVVYNFSNLRGRRVWLVEINQDRIEVGEVGVVMPPRRFVGAGAIREFLEWCDGLDIARTHLVLFIRAGGAVRLKEIKPLLEERNASFGVDLLDANTPLLDPERGAGA